MSTCKIEILEHHTGELGEAIQHEDHLVESECYHYDSGSVLEVAVHDDFHERMAYLYRSGFRSSLQDRAGEIPSPGLNSTLSRGAGPCGQGADAKTRLQDPVRASVRWLAVTPA